MKVGKLKAEGLEAALSVNPTRIIFKVRPSFDPLPWLDRRSHYHYLYPNLFQRKDYDVDSLPSVHVHCGKEQLLELCAKLDDYNLLKLYDVARVDRNLACGLFAVRNNAEKDRLIVDARRANTIEAQLKRWTCSMAFGPNLARLYLRPHQIAVVSAEDLSDYYSQYVTTEARSLRNVFDVPLGASDVRHFKAFTADLEAAQQIYAALGTLAMGDLNAVEFGQNSHLSLALTSKAIKPQELVFIGGRIPRTSYVAGVIQDDHASVEFVDRDYDSALPDASGIAARRFAILRGTYRDAHLAVNEAKAVRGAKQATIWGAQIEGVKGHVGAPSARRLTLAYLTLLIVRVGFATVALLEIIIGSWVAICLYRRRLLCCLDLVYEAVAGRNQDDLLRLSSELKAELVYISLLVPFAYSDMRAAPSRRVWAVDSSSRLYASCVAPVSTLLGCELQRHVVQKGLWAKLLPPSNEWRRSHGILDPEDELPGEGVMLASTRVWSDVLACSKFEVVKIIRVRGRKHINLTELYSEALAEEASATEEPNSRPAIAGDSQVVGAVIAKGRSSSPAINHTLSAMLPVALGGNIYPGTGWVRSADNVCDDPTRGVSLRAPASTTPAWLSALEEGSYELLDAMLEQEDADAKLKRPELVTFADIRNLANGTSGEGEDGSRSSVAVGQPNTTVERRKAQATTFTRFFLAFDDRFIMRQPGLSIPSLAEGSNPGALVAGPGSRRLARHLLAAGVPWVLVLDSHTFGAVALLSHEIKSNILRGVHEQLITAVVLLPWQDEADTLHMGALAAVGFNEGIATVVMSAQASKFWSLATSLASCNKLGVGTSFFDSCMFGAEWKIPYRCTTNLTYMVGSSVRCWRPSHDHIPYRIIKARRFGQTPMALPHALCVMLSYVIGYHMGHRTTYRSPLAFQQPHVA